jgi:hypothetical protein
MLYRDVECDDNDRSAFTELPFRRRCPEARVTHHSAGHGCGGHRQGSAGWLRFAQNLEEADAFENLLHPGGRQRDVKHGVGRIRHVVRVDQPTPAASILGTRLKSNAMIRSPRQRSARTLFRSSPFSSARREPVR